MLHARPVTALAARGFGRGRSWLLPEIKAPAPVSGDLKLFGATFLAGFIFVSVLLA